MANRASPAAIAAAAHQDLLASHRDDAAAAAAAEATTINAGLASLPPPPPPPAGLQGHYQGGGMNGLEAAAGALTLDSTQALQPSLPLLVPGQPGYGQQQQQQALQPATAVSPRRSRHRHRHHHHHHHHNGTKPKRPPPAPPADGSAGPPAPVKPVLPPDGSVKTCEAVDRYDELCEEVVVGGWKGKVPRRWCQIHEDEEKHVRSSFWSAPTLVSFP